MNGDAIHPIPKGILAKEVKGSALLVYAAMFSFSDNGEKPYENGVAWLADYLNLDRRTTQRILRQFLDRGIVKKIERNKTTGETDLYILVSLRNLSKKTKSEEKQL